ncbi:hypothetical protein FB45DRAFT_990981 [Roridomyces roridus]|uniref:Arf-GAP domain-containing protein n=1 Tax=Roridomyces roridus TaxID=1738132 RepID=A0AAD7FMX3_9AGAR|nr:hypothetical protein FB45DRAFT_990981 [Roridomyces roridus]
MALNKIAAERNQKTLLELVVQPGNDICADCKVKNPRWASHSLGIFICVNCASIHRKIGTHVSKVKSLTMDSWTREQTDNMRLNGNLKSNQLYNPNEARHPPPPNLMDGERDSEMEQYIRSKYEYKSFVDKSALVASKLGPSRSAASLATRDSPAPTAAKPPPSPKPPAAPARAATAPVSYAAPTRTPTQPAPTPQPPPTQSQAPPQSVGGVWNDLISLQSANTNSNPPLQFQASLPGYGQQQSMMPTGYQPQMAAPTGMGMMANPYQSQFAPSNPYPSQFTPSFSLPTITPATPLYNPQPQTFGQQQQLFQGQPVHSPIQSPIQSPIAQGSSPGPFGLQPPAPSMTPTYGNQMLGMGSTPSPQPFVMSGGSPHPFMSSSPQPGPFMSSSPQPGPFMSSSPQPAPFMSNGPQAGAFQPQGQFMGQPFQQQMSPPFQQQQHQQQQWGYVPQQQQQQQWGGM